MGLAKNSFLYLVSNVFIKATSFFLLPLYSHLISPDVYGVIYTVSAFSNFLVMLLPVSLSICISRFYFDCYNFTQVKKLYSTILLYTFLSSTILVAPFIIWSRPLSSFLNIPFVYYTVGVISAYLSVYYQLILSLLYVNQQAKKISITSILLGIFQIVLQLVLVISLEDKGFALLLTILLQSILSFILFVVYSKPFLVWHIDISNFYKYIKYSLSQFPSDIAGWLVNFTHRIFINKYIGSNSAGIYGIGSNIGQIPAILFNSVNSAFTPYVNSLYKQIEDLDDNNLKNNAKHSLSNTFMIVSSFLMMSVALLIMFSDNIVSLLNSKYASAYGVVVVMLLTSLMNSYRCMYMAPLAYNIKYTKIKSLIWVIAGLINIILNFLLIPRYGIYAACLNSLVTYCLTFILMLYYGKKAINVTYIWGPIIKILFISLCYFLLSLLFGEEIRIYVKLSLVPLYLYICFYRILNINLVKLLLNYVKVVSH
jgi:O-antigen/teichoic acid export membrane protein